MAWASVTKEALFDQVYGAVADLARWPEALVSVLAAVLNVMPNAALLLDREGRILHANFAAESVLNANDGLSFDRNRRLQPAAVLPTESGALMRALALALDVAAGASVELWEPVRITRPSGAGALLVIPVPLPPPAFALWELSDTARVLVLIIDPGARNLTATPALQATFGLTSAEARVAALVGSGLSGPQTAQTLGVSPATVKTHLARCFEKMGIRSQVELARMLSALPIDRKLFDPRSLSASFSKIHRIVFDARARVRRHRPIG